MNPTIPAPSRLQPVTLETAPEGSRAALTRIKKRFGSVPNLMATFANSPAVIEGYLALDAQFDRTGFTPIERQFILLAVSVENECGYCIAAHSTALKRLMLADPGLLIEAVCSRKAPAEPKLAALVALVREIVSKRGYAAEGAVEAFLTAGYRREQLIELLLGVALKTISNYLEHLNPVPVDTFLAAGARA